LLIRVMRTGIIAGAAIILVAVGLFGALDVAVSPVSCTTQGTATVEQTTSVASTVATTAIAQIEQTTTQTERVYNFNPVFVFQPTLTSLPNIYLTNPLLIITPNQYVYQNFPLVAGMNVQMDWIANNTLDVYVFNSSENAAYANSNATTTSPNMASSPNSRVGSLSFDVPVSDTYYVAFFNPHNGSQGPGSYEVQLINATGTATFQVTTATSVTQTTTTVVFVPQQVTATQTTTGTYRRTADLLSQLGGTECSG
ncbi:MAG: hypothetical protein ACRD6W_11045, partial [Nitrososphaerales archaeon]